MAPTPQPVSRVQVILQKGAQDFAKAKTPDKQASSLVSTLDKIAGEDPKCLPKLRVQHPSSRAFFTRFIADEPRRSKADATVDFLLEAQRAAGPKVVRDALHVFLHTQLASNRNWVADAGLSSKLSKDLKAVATAQQKGLPLRRRASHVIPLGTVLTMGLLLAGLAVYTKACVEQVIIPSIASAPRIEIVDPPVPVVVVPTPAVEIAPAPRQVTRRQLPPPPPTPIEIARPLPPPPQDVEVTITRRVQTLSYDIVEAKNKTAKIMNALSTLTPSSQEIGFSNALGKTLREHPEMAEAIFIQAMPNGRLPAVPKYDLDGNKVLASGRVVFIGRYDPDYVHSLVYMLIDSGTIRPDQITLPR